MVTLLSVMGRKGSGKSAVIEGLVAQFSSRGLRVGVLKRVARPDAELDEPGRDSSRYRASGAAKVVLAGRTQLALFEKLAEEQSLDELLALFERFDLVILEGYYLDDAPKIEVYRQALGDLLLTERMANVLAICSQARTARDVPHFTPSELGALADYLETKLFSKEAAVR